MAEVNDTTKNKNVDEEEQDVSTSDKKQSFDYSLAQPTDKQQVESMRIDPYDDTYANFMYGQSVGDESVNNITPKVEPLPKPKATSYTTAMTSALPDSVRKTLQKKQGKFVAPHPYATRYEQLRENMDARDEYDKEQWNKSEKWRKISQAIIGAGEIAARGLLGASGSNVTGDIMLQQDAQGLEHLKYLRQRNKERFNTELAWLQQNQANDLAKRRLSMQEAQQRENLAYKYKALQQKIDAAEASGDLKTAQAHKYEMDALLAEAKANGYGAYLQSVIARNYASANASNSTANKNNNTVANGKTKPYVAGKKTYDIPKNLNLGDVYRALQGKLGYIEGLTDKKIDKWRDDSYNGVASIVNKIAERYPNETDEVIKALGGVESANVSSGGGSTSSSTSGSTGSSSSSSSGRTGNGRTTTTQRRHLKNPYGKN